jgi:twitching motility protein PilT
MAILGFGKKKPLERALESAWANEEEKQQLIVELRDAGIKPVAAIPLLWVKDASVRQVGVERFLDGADLKAVQQLFGELTEQSSHARTFVARLIPRLDDGVVNKALDGLMRDADSRRQRLAWEMALNLRGPSREAWLVRAVTDGPGPVRLTAVRGLAQDGQAQKQMDLFIQAAKDNDSDVAAAALEAIIALPDARVIDLMIDRFAHGDATARDKAAQYLRHQAKLEPTKMRGRMLNLMGEGEDATRRLSVEILLATGAATDVLLDILRFSTDLVGWLRTRILETLQTFGDVLLEPALSLLGHQDEHVRTNALVLAEQFNDPRVVAPVCTLLKAPDWWLRITACDTLGRLKDERAVPALVEALADEDTRWAAIDALAQIGSSQALKPLVQILRDPRAEVRLEVVRAFSRFDDQRLIPYLQQLVEKDPSSEVRTRAAEVARDLSQRLNLKHTGSDAQTSAVNSSTISNPVDKLLAQVREQGASDLHISVGEPPIMRRNGRLERVDGWKPLPAPSAAKAVLSLLTPRQRDLLEERGEIDLCYSIPEVGRYRVNAFKQRKGICAAFRVIPNTPPTFTDIRLPGRLTELLDYHQGLIVVSGPASSGKSTTLAAVVNLINESKASHVITLEDPIEFVHPVKSALINQREVGKHTESFARALRGALREDPDVIMVGELRDPETMRMAMEAAETGHLVIATMHTTSAVQTIERLVQSFPPEEQGQVRMGLSESLKWVISQSLIPRADGKGRVAVYELLKNTFSMGNLIRDDKTFQIPSLMQIGRRSGMQTVDQALLDLVEAQLITPEAAWGRAVNPDTFAPMCQPGFLDKQSDEPETPETPAAG